VEEAVAVHVGKAAKYLEYDILYDVLREQVVALLHQLVQVLVHELEDHVKVVVLSDDFFEADNVRMADFLEGFDLAQTHALLPRVVLLLHLLDGDLFPRVLHIGQ